MADEAQVAQLRKGVAAWNQWREANPAVAPDLTGITLEGGRLSGINFKNVNFEGANLGRLHLIGANLEGANLSRTTLTDATLVEADLRNANLSGAKFSGCTIIRANLSGANLSAILDWLAAQLRAAYWSELTTWPDGYHPPSSQRLP